MNSLATFPGLINNGSKVCNSLELMDKYDEIELANKDLNVTLSDVR